MTNTTQLSVLSFRGLALVFAVAAGACGDQTAPCPGVMTAEGRCVAPDAATSDAGSSPDAGSIDAAASDAAPPDAAPPDAGFDACAPDELACNEVDDDCDGIVDEEVQTTFYADADGDGFGDPATTCAACAATSCPEGRWVENDADCDDGAEDVHPADDPSAPELVCNEVDDDCDGVVDEGVQTTFYADMDGDGFGDAGATVEACAAPSGYVDNADDCADTDARAHPGQTEYFATSVMGLPGVYDFNCSGTVEYARDHSRYGLGPVASAAPVPAGRCTDRCDGQDHWVGGYPPCGGIASYWYCGVTDPSSGRKICLINLNPVVLEATALCH